MSVSLRCIRIAVVYAGVNGAGQQCPSETLPMVCLGRSDLSDAVVFDSSSARNIHLSVVIHI